MKIVLVENADKWSGACYEVLLLAKGLIKLNHKVYIISKPFTSVTQRFKKEGLDVFECKITNDGDIIALFKIKAFLKKIKPDIVEIYNQKAYWIVSIICKIRKIKCIINRNIHLKSRTKKLFSFLFNRLVDKVVAVSKAIKDTLHKDFKVNCSKIEIIYPCKDLDIFKNNDGKTTLRKELGFPDDIFVFGFIGRITPEKGLYLLIEAFSSIIKKYNDAKLVIIGDGNNNILEKLKKLIIEKNLSNSVVMLGFRTDILNVFNAINTFVHPSFSESFSLSNIEVMASKKTLISTSVGGVVDYIIDNENGFLIPPKTIDELKYRMLYVMENREILKTVSENAKKTVFERFGQKNLINDYLKLYKTLTKNN